MVHTSPSYNPERLVLSKREILDHFDRAIERLKKSPNNWRFTKELQLVKFLVSKTPEQNFPYYWMEINKIFDAVRTENQLRLDGQQNPKILPLAEIAKRKVSETILTVPAIHEFDAIKMISEVKKSLQFGAMKNEV